MKASRTLLAAALALGALWAAPASAHCDTLDGPVVASARDALATAQVERALAWVRKADEPAIRSAFAKARAARAKGATPDGAADQAFYATLVRLHRAGEGEPFTGLKPAGTIAPHVAAADAAVDSGNPEALERMIVERTRAGLHQRYEAVAARRDFSPTDVEAGRAYVSAYVAFVHHAERLHDAAAASDAHDQHAKAPARPGVADAHSGAAVTAGHRH